MYLFRGTGVKGTKYSLKEKKMIHATGLDLHDSEDKTVEIDNRRYIVILLVIL